MDTKPDLTNNNNNNNKRITPLETDPKSNLKLKAENKINKKQQTKNSKQQQQQQEQKQPKTKKEQWQHSTSDPELKFEAFKNKD